jgi:hypothetical protein
MCIYLITIKSKTCKTYRRHRFNIPKYANTLDELYSMSIATSARALTISNIDPSLITPSPSQSLITPLIRKRGHSQEDTPRSNKLLQVDTSTSDGIVQMALAIEAIMRSREGKL